MRLSASELRRWALPRNPQLLAEFMSVYTAARLRGVDRAIAYLRNPNPLLTAPLLRAFGAEVGTGTTFKRTLLLDNVREDENSTGDFSHLRVGNKCYIGDDVYLDLAAPILIADEVVLSGRVSLLTHADCNRSTFLRDAFPRRVAAVTLQQGCWIGFGATVLCGCTVAPDSVVASHSLLRQDTEARTVFAGVPARRVRSIP